MANKFVAVSKNLQSHKCLKDQYWTEDLTESVNKEPTFPKMPKPRGPGLSTEYKVLQRIAQRLRPIVRGSLVRGINEFKEKIDLNDLIDAVSKADAGAALEVVPWDDFQGAVKGIDKAILDGVSESAEQSKFLMRNAVKSLVPSLAPEVSFNPQNPRLLRWIENHIAELVTNVRENTKKAIQQIIIKSMNEGMPPRESAKLIKKIVGLNDRQVGAVLNRRDALIKKGLKGAKLEDAIEKYTQKQLKYRSELIARTEAMTANNHGMMEVMDQNADKGLFDRNKAKKVWIVTPYDRVCPICKPMHKKKVDMDAEFRLRNGKTVNTPPAHPNCNCAWAIDLEGAI